MNSESTSIVLNLFILCRIHINIVFGFSDSCPTDDSTLMSWYPLSDPHKDVTIGKGMRYRLEQSVELGIIYIKDGGELVLKDGPEEVSLSVKFIHIENDGAFRVGSESCRHRGKATIIFRGKSHDKDIDDTCGKKGICVASGGILEMHGSQKLSWTLLDKTLWKGEYENMITLADDITSWHVGDKIVISSTDNDMYHTEEFVIVHCSECSKKQLKIHGSVKYNHYGEKYKGIDMRAEVGILTRNVRTRGEMEPHCYGTNWCQYFTYDTFGGHLMFLRGFKRIQLEGVEIKHMGQQANLGRYPVHFHDAGDLADTKLYSDHSYVRDLSIHHCYNRCVTVHGTSSLVVSDVVGYDTLGHCFFLEDGNEQNNTFYHNLGLLTQYSTLLPTDRSKHMCMGILQAVWPGYRPSADECTAVSTFWIAHPNNHFIKNAAGGSEEAGFWFIFHEMPTGHGPGALPPFKALRTPMGKFYKNRAHSSNYGVYVDDGVKISEANKYKPQEYLSRQMAEYMPHKKSDPMKPRVPAKIDELTVFKNNIGVLARGGDILISKSKFADNGNAVEFTSSKSFPYDIGSHQEVYDCLFVGQSDNGNHWSRRKRDAEDLTTSTLDVAGEGDGVRGTGKDIQLTDRREPKHQHDQAIRNQVKVDMALTHAGDRLTGVDVQQGPVIIKDCEFTEFWGSDVAVTFSSGTPGHMSVLSGGAKLKFGPHINRFSLGVYPKSDGDKTRMFHDEDGSLLGFEDSYIMNQNNWLTRHDGCLENWESKCAICKGKYGSLFIRADPEQYQTLKIWRNEVPEKPLSLDGMVIGSGAMQRVEYHPNILKNKGYLLSWGWSLPHDIILYPVLFDKDDYVTIGLCVRDLHEFAVFWELEKKSCDNQSVIVDTERYFPASSWSDLHSMRNRFYVDHDTGLLFFKVKSRHGRSGYEYCSKKGCERLHFLYRGASPMQDCTWKAFPKYQWTDVVGETVPLLTGEKIPGHSGRKGVHPPHMTDGNHSGGDKRPINSIHLPVGESDPHSQSRPNKSPPTPRQGPPDILTGSKTDKVLKPHLPPMTPRTSSTVMPSSRIITSTAVPSSRIISSTLSTPFNHSLSIPESDYIIRPPKIDKPSIPASARNPYLSQQPPFNWRVRDNRQQNPYIND